MKDEESARLRGRRGGAANRVAVPTSHDRGSAHHHGTRQARSAPCHEMAPSILLSALALAAYWDYEVCVGTSAVQYHAAAGRRHPSHRLGSFSGAAGVGPRLRWRRRGRSTTVSLVCAPRAGILQVHEPEPYHYRLLLGTPAACRREAGLAAAACVGRTPARHVLHHRGPRVERRRPAAVRAPGRASGTPRGDGGRRRAAALRVERRGGASGGAADRAVRAARPDAGRRAPRAREHAHRAGGGRGRRDSAAAATATAAATVAEHAANADAAGGDGDGATADNMDKPVRGARRAPRRLPPACAAYFAAQAGVGGRRAAAPPPAVPRPAAEPEWRSRLAIAIVVAAFAVLITILARLDDSDDDGAAADGEHGPWGRVAARVVRRRRRSRSSVPISPRRGRRGGVRRRTPSAAATAAAAAVMVAAAVEVLATAVAGMAAPPAAEARRRS